MRVGLTIKGDKQFRRNLQRMTTLPKSNINAIMKDALDPMRDATQNNALKHRQPDYNPPGGHLDQGVVSVPVKETSRTRTTWWVSFTNRARKIAHLVEFGTAPHAQPRRGIMHPGARPFPFFRPAFEATKETTVRRLGTGVRNLILSRIKG